MYQWAQCYERSWAKAKKTHLAASSDFWDRLRRSVRGCPTTFRGWNRGPCAGTSSSAACWGRFHESLSDVFYRKTVIWKNAF
jgi:hypothetical protein